jgi:Lhr-like helicase
VPAPTAASPKMPFWHGDSLGRPLETGKAIGSFVREISALGEEAGLALLTSDYHLDRRAAQNLWDYLGFPLSSRSPSCSVSFAKHLPEGDQSSAFRSRDMRSRTARATSLPS